MMLIDITTHVDVHDKHGLHQHSLIEYIHGAIGKDDFVIKVDGLFLSSYIYF